MAAGFKTKGIFETCSIFSVPNNSDYVEGTKNKSKNEELTVLTSKGSLLFDWKGRLNILPLNVHVNENYLEKLISLKYVNNIPEMRMHMYKSIEKAMNVILRDGTVLKFKECGLGLYYYDMASTDVQDSAKTNTTITP